MKHATFLLVVALMVMPACKKADGTDGANIVSFTATPSATSVYSPAILSWSVQNATLVVLSGYGVVEDAGSRQVNPQDTTTYTLMAEGLDGARDTKMVTVTVDKATACQGMTIVEYRSDYDGMYVKVGPNASPYYAARNVTIELTLYDKSGGVIQVLQGVIPKINPGAYGSVTIRIKHSISYYSSKREIVSCECPLVQP